LPAAESLSWKENNIKPILSLFSFTFSLFLFSCGIEAFYYIDYIPPGVYNDTNAAITLPSSSTEGYTYFDNFIIFYRIYISANIVNTGRQLEGYGNNDGRIAINTTLNSDYNGLYSLTDITNTNVNVSNLENTFANRGYFLITLRNNDINNILGSGSLGRRLTIEFSPVVDTEPTLTVNGVGTYTLWRAIKHDYLNLDNFNPQPNRNLLNHSGLYNNTDSNNGVNADVAPNTTIGEYTYISMYIAARGTSLEMPPRTIYSQPTFIGIFQLANSL
jgi:hypothetical protein